ncbi:MAG TPA: hypothetical protein VKT32_12280 [Chthonomonadaceae bacterium]|nr:hypothetical protein [Chthonomonadaceae bacterium]
MASPTIEERVSELEKKVARLMEAKTEPQKPVPWWERHVGAFKDSSYYAEAMRLGAEYRRSQPTAADEHDDDVSAGH